MPTVNGQDVPWGHALPTELQELEATDAALERRIKDSELWKQIQEALHQTREHIWQTPAQSNEHLWMREGALGQLTYLLHHLPVLVVHCARQSRRRAEADGGR